VEPVLEYKYANKPHKKVTLLGTLTELLKELKERTDKKVLEFDGFKNYIDSNIFRSSLTSASIRTGIKVTVMAKKHTDKTYSLFVWIIK
jgi:hypothetical protein